MTAARHETRAAAFCPAVLWALLLFSATSAPGALSQGLFQPLLDAHNAHRKAHGAPPLTWNKGISQAADIYTQSCASGSNPFSTSLFGVNTWFGSQYFSDNPTEAVVNITKYWFSAGKGYDYSKPSTSPATTGPFSQIVWRSSTDMGCSINFDCAEFLPADGLVATAVAVCYYYPPGNVVKPVGDYSAYRTNVQKPGTVQRPKSPTTKPKPPSPPKPPPRRSPSPRKPPGPARRSPSPKKSPPRSPKTRSPPKPQPSPSRKPSPRPPKSPKPAKSPKKDDIPDSEPAAPMPVPHSPPASPEPANGKCDTKKPPGKAYGKEQKQGGC